jgi:hypothetical protein
VPYLSGQPMVSRSAGADQADDAGRLTGLTAASILAMMLGSFGPRRCPTAT